MKISIGCDHGGPELKNEIAKFLGLKTASYAMDRYIKPLLETGALELTIPERPRSTRQKYKSKL